MLVCDDCGQPADAVHFLDHGEPWHYPHDPENVEIKFSCPNHDFDGYWIYLNELDDPGDAFGWRRQLAGKTWRGDIALIRAGLLEYDDRQRDPTVTATRVDGHLVITCPWCGREHTHGAGLNPGDGDGHRVAHCGAHGGYYVKEVTR